MERSPLVTFVERSGDGAADALARLRDRLRRDGASARLLVGRDDPGVHLLIIEGEAVLEPDDLAGARTWRFRAADPASPHGERRTPA